MKHKRHEVEGASFTHFELVQLQAALAEVKPCQIVAAVLSGWAEQVNNTLEIDFEEGGLERREREKVVRPGREVQWDHYLPQSQCCSGRSRAERRRPAGRGTRAG